VLSSIDFVVVVKKARVQFVDTPWGNMINGCQIIGSGNCEEVEKGLVHGCGQVRKMFVSEPIEFDSREDFSTWLLETIEKQEFDILFTKEIF